MTDAGLVDVAVIGGGITGLAVAHSLQQAGQHFLLFEPGTPGGLISSRQIDGFTLENGPNVFMGKPALKRLLAELDLLNAMRKPVMDRYQQLIWFQGRALPAPKGPLAFLSSSLFTASEKCSIPRRIFRRGLLRPNADDASVADFFTPLLGRRVVQAVLDPALKGIYGGDLNQLSARSLFPGLWQAAAAGDSVFEYLRARPERAGIFVLEGGAQTMVARLLDRLPSEKVQRTAVRQLVPQSGGGFQLQLANGAECRARNVVVTTAGAATADYLNGAFSDLGQQLKNIPFASLSIVHCAVAQTALKHRAAFGIVFPAGAPHDTLGIMFNSILFPHIAPAQQELLTVCLGGSSTAGSPVHNDPEKYAQAAVKQYLGIESVRMLNSHTWQRAIPQQLVGHHHLVAHMRQVETTFPGIYFCGTDTGGVGVPDRVEKADELVKRLLR